MRKRFKAKPEVKPVPKKVEKKVPVVIAPIEEEPKKPKIEYLYIRL